jgi:hypothetical protein
MKRVSVVVVSVLLVLFVALSVMAAMNMKMSAKGQEVTITGKVSCTFCTLSHPGQACPKGCCANCIKKGDPPLLTDAKGNMYLLASNEMQVPLMTSERMKMTGSKCTIKGLLVKAKGIQVIFVDSWKMAK